MRLRLWGATVVLLCAVGLLGQSVRAEAAPAAPRGAGIATYYLNSIDVPAVTPAPFRFGGFTGLDAIGGGRYVAISGDLGLAGPGRFFTASIPFAQSLLNGLPKLVGANPILGPGFMMTPPGSARFEGIRKTSRGYVVVSGGDRPFVREISGAGAMIGERPLPRAYLPGRNSGLDPQRSLAGVAVGPTGRISVLTAGGLRQDPRTSARLLSFGPRGTSEFVYRTDGDKRAADVLAINTTDFLVLERGAGRITRIYWTTTRGAQQISGKQRVEKDVRAMPKRQIFSTAPIPRLAAGDISGLAWGPWAPSNPFEAYRARTLVMITDNSHGGPTKLHALEIRFPRQR
ncbi:esterase-like activity of phytase family protein [Gordonia sp. ABSL1-1]|uniref:esterase-like activity of phytase family protein n=1 Tax=Gordonia sp. ABSL1-1 TaxID=3053923 RepID=UPI00257452DA|nr:esterase-like activity of phytase family protein [Gordonia sp. ABSL1-1]MDL9935152.1 esterase-like activity of phytase family protein [Gordonia sp. ABSL1-1]